MSDTEYSFTILLEPEDGVFNVRVPALPEVLTFGATEAEALAMAADAIQLALAWRRDHGESIPTGEPMLRKVRVTLAA
jgi:antitoxin HicB